MTSINLKKVLTLVGFAMATATATATNLVFASTASQNDAQTTQFMDDSALSEVQAAALSSTDYARLLGNIRYWGRTYSLPGTVRTALEKKLQDLNSDKNMTYQKANDTLMSFKNTLYKSFCGSATSSAAKGC